MKYTSDIHTTAESVWANTGFKLSRKPARDGYGHCALDFEDLNPQVKFTRVVSRVDLARMAWWMLRQAVK